MNKLVLETINAQNEEIHNRFLAALESLIERSVKRVANSPECFGNISEAFINNPGYFLLAAAFFKSEKRNKNEKRAKIEEHCRKLVDTGMKLNRFAVSHQSEIGVKLPTDISDDVRTSPKKYSPSSSRKCSDYYYLRLMKPAWSSEFWHHKIKTNN